MKKGKKIVSLIILTTFVLATPVFAAEPSPWTKKLTYMGKTFGKFGFGLKNALLGWSEVLTEPYDAYKADESFLSSIGKGIYHACADTVFGVIQVGTFFIPIDLPLPEGGV